MSKRDLILAKKAKKKKPEPPPNPKYEKGRTVKWKGDEYIIMHVDHRPQRGVNNYTLFGMGGMKYFIKEEEIS